jgi:type III restriction enzyme
MALHSGFPESPHAILEPAVRWFPADEALRETSAEKLMPALMARLPRNVKTFREGGYVGTPGRRKLAVKVVDIFGNDTMTIVDVSV